ncbi:MAG: GDSL-type esterase/lipase family protein [Ktedonobacterales bacterium]
MRRSHPYRLLRWISRQRSMPLILLALALASCSSSADQAAPASSAESSLRATPTATIVPPVIYTAIGASDALGVGADNPATDGYVPRIIAQLPKGSLSLNLGVSGILLHDALQQELPQAIAFHPTLVTVWLVGNDFRECTPLDQYKADLGTLLTQLATKTRARVFVANTPDMSLLPFFAQDDGIGGGACVEGATSAQVRKLSLQWNAVMDPIILQHGDVLVDLYHTDLASHPDYVSSDGFHPSSLGYAQLANLFWAAITAHHAVPNS